MSVRSLHTPWVEASGINDIDQNENLTCVKESNRNENFIISTLRIEIENKFTSQKDGDQYSAYCLQPVNWSFGGKYLTSFSYFSLKSKQLC